MVPAGISSFLFFLFPFCLCIWSWLHTFWTGPCHSLVPPHLPDSFPSSLTPPPVIPSSFTSSGHLSQNVSNCAAQDFFNAISLADVACKQLPCPPYLPCILKFSRSCPIFIVVLFVFNSSLSLFSLVVVPALYHCYLYSHHLPHHQPCHPPSQSCQIRRSTF